MCCFASDNFLMKKLVFCLCLLLIFGILHAGSDSSNIRYGKHITVQHAVYGNFYVCAGTVIINAPVYGELVVAGGNVYINDTIQKDILITCGKVVLKGFAGDNLRCIAGTVKVRGNVKGDLVAAGGDILVDSNTQVGTILGVGANVTVNGNVINDIRGYFDHFELHGNVGNSVNCRSSHMLIDGRINGEAILSASSIIIGSNGYFGKNLHYWNRKKEIAINETRISGHLILDESLKTPLQQWYYLGFTAIFLLAWYLIMTIFLLLLLQSVLGKLFRKSIPLAGKVFYSIGYGLLFSIITPFIAAIIICTIVGIPVGLLLLGLYTLLLLSGPLLASLLLVHVYNTRLEMQWGDWKISFASFMVFIVIRLVSVTPFIGWITVGIVTLWALGAILMTILKHYRSFA